MLDLDCRVQGAGDVTLVGAVVESSAPTPRRVRVESTLDGPIWPPRRDGVPERGWDDEGFEGVVPADGRLAFGFATPAEPTDPPLYVVDHERASNEATAGKQRRPTVSIPEATPAGVLRALGPARPPRDVVPDLGRRIGPWNGEAEPPSRSARSSEPSVDRGPPGETLPAEVADWLRTVEDRIRRAEALADAGRLTAAARELERAGGLDDAERLVASLDEDERALRALARRAERLADRAAGADVPVSTFRQLA